MMTWPVCIHDSDSMTISTACDHEHVEVEINKGWMAQTLCPFVCILRVHCGKCRQKCLLKNDYFFHIVFVLLTDI